MIVQVLGNKMSENFVDCFLRTRSGRILNCRSADDKKSSSVEVSGTTSDEPTGEAGTEEGNENKEHEKDFSLNDDDSAGGA